MKNTIQISAAKNYFLGFATSGIFLVSGLYYFNSAKESDPTPHSFSENTKAENATLQNFNPNDLDEAEWMSLGFSERKVATILKYKSVVGGQFNSKEQLKKCYAISPEKFVELENYIILPETNIKNTSYKNYSSNYPKRSYAPYSKSYDSKGLKIPGKFNPDTYTAEDFMNLGFTEKQSLSIIKYKGFLGGSFISKEKFKECYMINEGNYKQLAPYLILPDQAPDRVPEKKSFSNFSEQNGTKESTFEHFDPNMTTLEEWRKLGFSEKQAQVIINYRDRNLKGSFKSLDDIERCFVISKEKFELLKPFIVLNPETMKAGIATSVSAPNSNALKNDSKNNSADDRTRTDFRRTDLNEITFKQLIEYGFDEKSAGSFISFRNKLGGFVTTEQIIDTYNIDKDLAQKLITTAPLFVNDVAKYSLTDAPEAWLKNHPYFKYYADKIIYYRITYSDEKKFFRMMKIKPEAEQKMRMYLK